MNGYLARFQLAPVFEAAELAHMLLPQSGVVETWVVESPGAPQSPHPWVVDFPGMVRGVMGWLPLTCRVMPVCTNQLSRMPNFCCNLYVRIVVLIAILVALPHFWLGLQTAPAR